MDEIKLFQRRYNEGYDLLHDERYNLWLKTFDPHLSPDTTPPAPTTDSAPLELDLFDSCSDSSVPPQCTDHSCSDEEVGLNQTSEEGDCVQELQQATVLSKCLSYHKPNIKIPERKAKKAGCVLTSQENLQILEEKEMKRKEEAEKKERARLLREEKRQQKKEEAEKKVQARLLREEKRLKQRKEEAEKKKRACLLREERKGKEAKRSFRQRDHSAHSSTSDTTSVNIDTSTRSPLCDPTFTIDETQLFQHRYNEGYDLHHDERYNNLWLKTFHPAEGARLSTVATPPSVHDGGDMGGPASGSESAAGQRMVATRSKVTLHLESAKCMCLSPSCS